LQAASPPPGGVIMSGMRVLLAGAVTLASLGTGVAVAQAPTSVVASDRADAPEGTPDLKRVGATRGTDGSVRFALSFAAPLTPADLLTEADDAGPPGSVCMRLWTTSTPRTTMADRLACVTSQPGGRAFRVTVTKEVPGALPSTVGTATLTRPSRTSIALRIPSGVFGTARSVRFAAEATRPGCVRLRCVDLAPDLGVTKTLRLRG
jgi:hypothetical protein